MKRHILVEYRGIWGFQMTRALAVDTFARSLNSIFNGYLESSMRKEINVPTRPHFRRGE